MDNELTLFDRINIIKDANKKYDLEHNAYISFSGGKDSVVLHHLIDMALPNNKIPRVFSNTGIEYNAIVSFVKREREKDDRIIVIHPAKNIRKMLEEVGYPFKSKDHSNKVHLWQIGSRKEYLMQYINGYDKPSRFSCPAILKYQFSDDFNIKISDKCCNELKKKPFKKWAEENHKSITITGMQRSEGGQRVKLNCIVTRRGKVNKFHPLAPVTDEWEKWFIDKYNIELCELYYPPYNFTRTGCKGCPYSLTLQKDMETMKALGMNGELKQMNIIWQKPYDEMKRIGYRLKKDDGQMTIDDFL